MDSKACIPDLLFAVAGTSDEVTKKASSFSRVERCVTGWSLSFVVGFAVRGVPGRLACNRMPSPDMLLKNHTFFQCGSQNLL